MNQRKILFWLVMFSLIFININHAQEIKIQVIVKNANVRLDPNPSSPIIALAQSGLIVQPIKKTEEWYFVELPPNERGDVIAGYIHQSEVKEIKTEDDREKIKPPKDTQEERETAGVTAPETPKKEKIEQQEAEQARKAKKKDIEDKKEKLKEFFRNSKAAPEWIVFSSNRDDKDKDDTMETDIYIMLTDGSKIKRLTDHPGNDWEPDLSPDGQEVVFVSDRDSKSGIYTVNVDGTGLKRLTTGSDSNYGPMWSPDGKKIAFVSDSSEGNQIFVMNADGSEVSQLTDNEINKQDPTWSPDGKKIAYVAFQEKTGYDIFIMTIDSRETKQLTDNSNFNLSPTWSPDGNSIAYESWDMSVIEKETPFLIFTATQSNKIFIIYQKDDRGIENIKSSIWVVEASGQGQKKLTKDDSRNWSPSWSPNGQQIVFSSDRGTDTKIYMMNADGTQVLAVSIDSGDDFTPRW
ncbi:MAG: DUF5050 domain-containing protein [Candidatus Aminicenantes bacterium]|nr:DUF5050 domain-containing protein [Candidatus Aminicenantes bacterium]